MAGQPSMTHDALTWLLTSTTYGTWLPGDARGFVGRVWEKRVEDSAVEGLRAEHDVVGTGYDQDIPGLYAASRARMKGDPVFFNVEQAMVVLTQFQETSVYRGWELHAASVMANYVHLVVTAPAVVQTDNLLRDFKSYASRQLSQRWGKPRSETWWTASGSRRRLPNDRATTNAIRYVLQQHQCLARWLNPSHGTIDTYLPSGGRQSAV